MTAEKMTDDRMTVDKLTCKMTERKIMGKMPVG
jgi:hypothetical protein